MNICFECDGIAEHEHHVIPFSLGGTKTVPLCTFHHGIIHGLGFRNHPQLIKIALKESKARGVILGRPRKRINIDKAREYQKQGFSLRMIGRLLKVHRNTLQRYLAI